MCYYNFTSNICISYHQWQESKDNIKLKTQLAGKATVKSPYLELKGSVIDISAKTDQPVGIGDLSQTINLLHDEVKSKIKSVLREAYQPKEI